MSQRVIVRPEAEADLAEAHRWYRENAGPAAADFLDDLEGAFSRIGENPLQFPVVHRTVRRALLQRFPYGVFFVAEPDRIAVLAVMHLARDPDRWKKRARR